MSKDMAMSDHRNLCVSFFAKAIFADEFWDEINLDYTGPLTCVVPRGRQRQFETDTRGGRDWSDSHKPGFTWSRQKLEEAGEHNLSSAFQENSFHLGLLAFKTVGINFCCFKSLNVWKFIMAARGNCYTHTHTHMHTHTHTHTCEHTRVCAGL